MFKCTIDYQHLAMLSVAIAWHWIFISLHSWSALTLISNRNPHTHTHTHFSLNYKRKKTLSLNNFSQFKWSTYRRLVVSIPSIIFFSSFNYLVVHKLMKSPFELPDCKFICVKLSPFTSVILTGILYLCVFKTVSHVKTSREIQHDSFNCNENI